MFTIPLEQLKEQVIKEAQISDDDLNNKIQKKMDELAGLVSEEGAAHIIANELGVKLAAASVSMKVKNLRPGVRNVDIVGKVTRKFEVKEFQSQRGPGKIGSFVFGDETGTIRAVLWNAKADLLNTFNENDIVKIVSGYIRDNQGRIELHLNDRSEVEVNPEGTTIENVAESQQPTAQRKAIADLQDNDQNVELLVTLVDIYDPRYFTVCPDCNKRVTEGPTGSSCQAHGTVQPATNYVVNAIGDDGTDTVRITLWKNQAERLFSKSEQEMLNYKEHPEQFQDAKHNLLGETIKFVGKVRKNEMFDRIEFSAQLVFTNPDPKEELQRLEKEN
jgi:replication factor A1